MEERVAIAPLMLAAVCVLVGLWLISIGVRGRQANAAPHCRKCGFDLSGTVDARGVAIGEARCPECGSPLNARGAITTGLRRRRPIVLLFGVVLALAPILAIVMALVGSLA